MFRNLSASLLNINASQRELLRLATIGNFEGVDLNMADTISLTEKYSPSYVKGMFESFNMVTGSWWLPFPLNAEEADYNTWINEKLQRYLQIAESINAPTILASMPSWSENLSYREAFKFYTKRLEELADMLKRYSCRLGVEFVSGSSLTKDCQNQFVCSLHQLMELLQATGKTNLGVVIDTWHWYASCGKSEELKELRPQDIVCVQVSDIPESVDINALNNSDRRMPGETGRFDIIRFLKVLDQAGYKGPVTPEPYNNKIISLPAELCVRLTGGYLLSVWKQFTQE